MLPPPAQVCKLLTCNSARQQEACVTADMLDRCATLWVLLSTAQQQDMCCIAQLLPHLLVALSLRRSHVAHMVCACSCQVMRPQRVALLTLALPAQVCKLRVLPYNSASQQEACMTSDMLDTATRWNVVCPFGKPFRVVEASLELFDLIMLSCCFCCAGALGVSREMPNPRLQVQAASGARVATVRGLGMHRESKLVQ